MRLEPTRHLEVSLLQSIVPDLTNRRAFEIHMGAILKMSDRRLWAGLALLLSVQAIYAQDATPTPQTTDQKIQQLEQKIEELDQRVRVADRNRELDAESAADRARTAATVGAEPAGITIRSNDQNFLLKIGLDVQVDNRTFPGDSSLPLTDQILIRRARP